MSSAQDAKQLVFDRARGRCESCLLPESAAFHPHQIDPIPPRQPGGRDDADNLALCCVTCNRYKGPNLATLDPETGATAFFHPRRHRWDEHFRLEEGYVIGTSPEGRATVFVFRFNDELRFQRLSDRGR